MQAHNIAYKYVNANGHTVTVIKPKKDPKRITAHIKGSTKHCGKTNKLGQVV